MNEFVYSYPVKVYFGEGAAAKYLPGELSKIGDNVLLAYGGGSIKKNGVYDEITKILKSAGKNVAEFTGIMSNPTYAKVQEGARLVREKHIDFILAVGGGSVVDCCKVVSAQAKIDQDIWDYEYIDKKIPSEFVPLGAVVTVTGTGAEMNNGAVITHEEKQIKGAVWAAFANFAILDPSYTLSVPEKQAVSGAFDTMSHCMETYFGMPGSDNLSDRMNEAVMRSVIENIRAMLKDFNDVSVRSELAWASAMAENGILKIGKVTDFQAHQIEHQLGAFTDCNHGAGLAVIHPALYKNLSKAAPEKFAQFAVNVWDIDSSGKSAEELATEGVEALTEFIREVGMPLTFSEMGITDEEILRKTADTCNLTAGCCKKLDRDEIFELLKAAM